MWLDVSRGEYMTVHKRKTENTPSRQGRLRKSRAAVGRRQPASGRQVEHSAVAVRPDLDNPKQLTEEGHAFETEVTSGVVDTHEADDTETTHGR
jgi:hypothetical protein